jgi:hypothetical protein
MNENLTTDERACLDGITAHGKPIVIKSMSAGARIKVPGFRLGAIDSLAEKGIVSKKWDRTKNGFVYTVAGQ